MPGQFVIVKRQRQSSNIWLWAIAACALAYVAMRVVQKKIAKKDRQRLKNRLKKLLSFSI